MQSRTRRNHEVLDAILAANKRRKKSLVRLKLDLMSGGVFPFFRATNHLFAAEWFRIGPKDSGPNALICGDLHLENFGAYLTEDGKCRFAINDFDEAYVAPVAYDLVRCAASIFLAGETWRLLTSSSAAMVVEFLDAYREGVATSAVTGLIGEATTENSVGAILQLLTPTAVATREELIAKETRPSKRRGHPVIRLNAKRKAVNDQTRAKIDASFQALAERSPEHKSIKVIDVTTRIAGLGSLGLRRYLVLVRGDDTVVRLLDVKETTTSALESYINVPQPTWSPRNADRSTSAERLILENPASGLATIEIGDYPSRVREMIPDSNRSSLDRLSKNAANLRQAVRVAGSIAAWAHVRGVIVAGSSQVADLNAWASGATFDSVMVAAARAAGQSRDDYDDFCGIISKRSVRRKLGLGPMADLNQIVATR